MTFMARCRALRDDGAREAAHLQRCRTLLGIGR
jgi:hypothetical protein